MLPEDRQIPGDESLYAAKPESKTDLAAHEAATSPHNDLAEPTEGQKEAGNYAKGHVRIGGLDVSIENPAGSERSGVGRDGKPWSTTMEAHYGYIRGSEGRDGETPFAPTTEFSVSNSLRRARRVKFPSLPSFPI